MTMTPKRLIDVLVNPAALWRLLGEYFNTIRLRRQGPIQDQDTLQEFLNSRASFVAQTSLYGYLRTRAGMRYPELFDDEEFVRSINIAKWQIWLACLSDLAVYTGGFLYNASGKNDEKTASIINSAVENIIKETGVPDEAGSRFSESIENTRKRLAFCNWQNVSDDEGPFSHSPQALVEWAPIIDELKQLDQEIVVNSVRFRWQKIRREMRECLDAAAIIASST